jgi:hypothetical protein
MAGTTVREGTANLAMAYAVADITRTVSLETQRAYITVPQDLRPAQAEVGAAGYHSAEGPDAAGGLSNDCASFQSAVEIQKADDGE